jgi:hypothetical protein
MIVQERAAGRLFGARQLAPVDCAAMEVAAYGQLGKKR